MTTGNTSQSTSNPGSRPLSRAAAQTVAPRGLWAFAGTLAALGLAYGPNLSYLSSIWLENANYSHGWLVVPIALVIAWQRLSASNLESLSRSPSTWWLAWCVLGAIFAGRAFAYEQSLQWTESATMVPAIVCVAWIFGGWPLLERLWPAIAFLVFMFPLPPLFSEMVALPLQQIAATGSCFLLQLTGLWAIQEGNTIDITTAAGAKERLDVALACNGLSMLMTLAATMTATIVLISLPTWKRIALLVSVVPIALLTNMVRIVTTGWCYYLIHGPAAKAWAHDISGWMMMPLALLLVGLEIAILSWVQYVDPEPAEDERRAALVMITEHSHLATSQPNAVVKKGLDPEV
jgi:exosortase